MPIGISDDGTTIISSARDIGNIVAGYIVGYNEIPWAFARLAFDLYQGSSEGISTQNAEFLGWKNGYSLFNNYFKFNISKYNIFAK